MLEGEPFLVPETLNYGKCESKSDEELVGLTVRCPYQEILTRDPLHTCLRCPSLRFGGLMLGCHEFLPSLPRP